MVDSCCAGRNFLVKVNANIGNSAVTSSIEEVGPPVNASNLYPHKDCSLCSCSTAAASQGRAEAQSAMCGQSASKSPEP